MWGVLILPDLLFSSAPSVVVPLFQLFRQSAEVTEKLQNAATTGGEDAMGNLVRYTYIHKHGHHLTQR